VLEFRYYDVFDGNAEVIQYTYEIPMYINSCKIILSWFKNKIVKTVQCSCIIQSLMVYKMKIRQTVSNITDINVKLGVICRSNHSNPLTFPLNSINN